MQAANNFLQVFLAPVVSSLSDRFGRKYIYAIGTLGPLTWFLGLPLCTTLFHRKLLEAVAWGVRASQSNGSLSKCSHLHLCMFT